MTSFACSAPARPSRRQSPLATEAKADTETNDEKRKARYKETDHVKAFYRVNRYPQAEGGTRADQENRTSGTPQLAQRRARRPRPAASTAAPSCAAPASPPARLPPLGALPLGSVRKAEAGPPPAQGAAVTLRKNICTHCSVGCTVMAEVSNGVWIGQEPGWDSPINRGSHCAKGAATRELVHGDRRLRYPMKMVERPVDADLVGSARSTRSATSSTAIREKSGPDSVYWLGSAKFTNEGAYLNRKFAAFWGTNNSDHQARICHSTTVAGVANTWGYGAMTNSYNDIRNAKTMVIMGGNPAEAHPVSLQHVLEGKELNRANMIVIDPRMTRTAAHATEYVRIRSGTDIPVIWGMLWHIFKNGWEDKEFIQQRVYGMDDIRKEVEKWTPEEVERVSGVPGAQLERVAKMFATEKPATLIWCMGATQHTVGTANVRAFCIALLATGNVGKFGTGANIFRGHTNVQGATDLGLDIVTLPLYYGLAEGAWRHWCRVWEVDYAWMESRFDTITGADGKPVKMMNTPGIPSTRWFDATLYDKDQVSQKDNLKAMFIMGHGGNTVTRIPEASKGIEKLDLLVVADPVPTTWAVHGRAQGQHLPAADRHQLRDRRLAHRLEPLDPVGRADRQADLRVEGRQRGDVPAGEEARLRRQDVQEHQGREQRAGRRGHPARDQSRRLVDRLLRPVAGAAQGAHEEPGQVRPGDAARAEGPARDRRRLLRPAVAVLGHAGAAASRHAHALQHQPARHGRRRHVPRPLRRRARGQDQGHGERRRRSRRR